MKKNIPNLFFLILLTFLALTSRAQKSQQLWAAVEISKALKDDFDLAATLSWRQTIPHGEWKRSIVHLTGSYTFKALRIMSSFSIYHTTEHNETDLFELRPWQAIAATYPDWNRVEVVHLIRFEERFQKEDKAWTFSPRARYEASTRIALTKNSLDSRTLYLYGAIEWLNNFKKPLVERFSNTRATSIGLGFRFNGNSRVEAIYEADVTDNVREKICDIDVSILRFRWLLSLN